MADEGQMQLPEPDPALKRLDRFLGSWKMEGNLVGSTEKYIEATSTYRWLPGGFFMLQEFQANIMGMEIHSHEVIGYDAETDTFPSTVYSNVSPAPLPYRWKVGQDGSVEISVKYGPMDSTFKGEWSEDGKTFSGGWRPNPGADESINVAYDISGGRAP